MEVYKSGIVLSLHGPAQNMRRKVYEGCKQEAFFVMNRIDTSSFGGPSSSSIRGKKFEGGQRYKMSGGRDPGPVRGMQGYELSMIKAYLPVTCYKPVDWLNMNTSMQHYGITSGPINFVHEQTTLE